MSKADKQGRETWLVLQRLREASLLAPSGDHARYEVEVSRDGDYPSVQDQISILANLLTDGAIKIYRRDLSVENATAVVVFEDLLPRNPNEHSIKGVNFDTVSPKFMKIYTEYATEYGDQTEGNEIYKISIKDREIWINDFLLSRPLATRKRMALIEYLYDHPNKRITRKTLPVGVRQEIKETAFSNMINGLGFKGETLKAFFTDRSKGGFVFRKKVSREQLEKDGVKINDFIEELKAAHNKNTPKLSQPVPNQRD